jgi:hypothetical protein
LLGTPIGDFSEQEVRTIIKTSNDPIEIRRQLLHTVEEKTLDFFLMRMQRYGVYPEQSDAASFLLALCDVYEHYWDNRPNFKFDPRTSYPEDLPLEWIDATKVARQCLNKFGSEADRLGCVSTVIRDSNGLFLPALFADLLATDKPTLTIFNNASRDTIRALATSKLEDAASSGSLIENPVLGKLLFIWRGFDTVATRKWTQSQLQTENGTRKLFKAFSTELSNRPGMRLVDVHDLSQYADRTLIETALMTFNLTDEFMLPGME